MIDFLEKGEFFRLEDFIALAKMGKGVRATVELRKQQVDQRVHPGDTEEMKGEVGMYLLIANFAFDVSGIVKNVSKVYMFGSLEESLDASHVNRNIANERLKVDYNRLQDVNIQLKEKYF